MIVYLVEWFLKHIAPPIQRGLKDRIILLGGLSWILYNIVAISLSDNWLRELNDGRWYRHAHFNVWGYMYFILGPLVAATIFKLSLEQKLLSIKWKCSIGMTMLWVCFCFAANPNPELDSEYFCSYLALPTLFYIIFWSLYWIFYEKIKIFNLMVRD